jgi:hypothetical protein
MRIILRLQGWIFRPEKPPWSKTKTVYVAFDFEFAKTFL